MTVRRLLPLVLVVGLMAGCINMSSTFTVGPDGSGTFTERVTISPQLAQMMKGMQQQGDTTQTDGELFSKEKIQARADTLEGLRLESTEMISGPEGEGYEAVYAFNNLNDVRHDPKPGEVMPDKAKERADGDDETSDLLSEIDMSFEPGSPATLTIRMPRDTSADPSLSMETPGEGPPSEQELRMTRKMMSNSGFRLAIDVDGEIIETNATHRSGSTITLVDMNFGELARDSTAFREVFASEEEPESAQAAIEYLNSKPGLTLETNETVTIRFQ